MPAPHATGSARPGVGRHAPPLQRSPGWWVAPSPRVPRPRTPMSGPLAPRPDDSARHRVTESTGRVPRRPRRPGGHRRSLGPRAQLSPRRRFLRDALLAVLATVVLGPAVAFVAGYLLFPVPVPDDAVRHRTTVVAYADGTPIAKLTPAAGVEVPIGSVPVPVRDAVLAVQDPTFSTDPGLDAPAILHAAWNQLRGVTAVDPTITQQYLRDTSSGDRPTLWRTYEDTVLSVKVSGTMTKDQILGAYLGAVYFGRGAYGIQAASRAYFAKNVSELSTAEGAVLAGLIRSPSQWDPAAAPERAAQRWGFVLDRMVAQGTLTPVARAAARFPATVPRRVATGGVPADGDGHIASAVAAELDGLGLTGPDPSRRDLRVTVSVDPARQRDAVAAAHEALAGQPALRGAVVAIDPGTGGVLAYYGGDDGLGVDHARVGRPAGSTVTPFVVLAALRRDPPVGLGETVGVDCEGCDVTQAMTVSDDGAFYALARELGPDAVAAAAASAGVTAPLDADPAGAPGGGRITPLDLASAYATIAAGGVWHRPHLVTSVSTADGRVLYRAPAGEERRFPDVVARNVTEAMLGVAAHDGLALPGGQPVAVSTAAVTSPSTGRDTDAWTAGFTPSVATSVWLGTDPDAPIRTRSGAPMDRSRPGDVWRTFVTGAMRGGPVRPFAPFRPVGRAPAPAPASRVAARVPETDRDRCAGTEPCG